MMNQQQLQKYMQEAVSHVGLQNKNKKDLQDMAAALQLSNKLKKTELQDAIGKQLYQVFQLQQKTNEVSPQIQAAFQNYNALQQIMNKFYEILTTKGGYQKQQSHLQQQQYAQQGMLPNSGYPYSAYQGQQNLSNSQFQQQQLYLQQQLQQPQQQYLGQNQITNQYQQQQQLYQQQLMQQQYQQQQQQQLYQQQMEQQQRQQYQYQQQMQQQQLIQQQQQQLAMGKNSNSHSCICQVIPKLYQQASEHNLVECSNTECKRKYHATCIQNPDKEIRSNFECFNCILSKYDPLHQVIEEIVPPGPIKTNQTTNIKFLLTGEKYDLLFKKSEQYFIEVRCIRIDLKHLYETTWPDYGEMEINDQKVMEFKPLQINSSLKKRKDEKFFLRDTQILQSGQNSVTIKEFPGNSEQRQNFRIQEHIHIVAIYIVKKLTPESLAAQVRKESVRPEQECKDLIKGNFSKSKDEVSIDKLNVSLNCNFDLQMIKTPAKGRWCKHLQCFSLENFIIFTESTIPRKWKCPHCKQKCYDLVVDEYMLKIIEDCKSKNLSVSDVTFNENAEFTIEAYDDANSDMEEEKSQCDRQKQEQQSKEQESKDQQQKQQDPTNNQVIVLDSDDEGANASVPNSNKNNSNSQIQQQGNTNNLQQQEKEKEDNQQLQNQQKEKRLQEEMKTRYDLSIPQQIDLEKGPFSLEKLEEKPENKKIRDYFMQSLKESQNFYKEEDFDDFSKEDYKEEVEPFVSDKITEIANYKITKNVKKQYPEIFTILKKDMIIGTQNEAYYQQMQRINSFNYQQHFSKPQPGEEEHFKNIQKFYQNNPYPQMTPQQFYYQQQQALQAQKASEPSKKHQPEPFQGGSQVNLESKQDSKKKQNKQQATEGKQSEPICID